MFLIKNVKSSETIKPVVKWPGGKRQLVSQIKRLMPEDFNQYYEPFIGGGALFFNIAPENAVINDANKNLIAMYKHIRDRPDEFCNVLSEFEEKYNSLPTMEEKDSLYYKVRSEFNGKLNVDSLENAARLVFLNKAGFNGLYRVNRQCDFNVPSGHKHTISLFDWDNIMEMSEQLKRTNIYYGDFRMPCEYAQCGDFVMFDPPYHETFTNYQAAGFTNVDQQRLFDFYEELSCRGVYCLQTNSDSEFIRTLYHNYNIIPVNVNHSINADGNNRKAKEIIITNYKSDCEAFVA